MSLSEQQAIYRAERVLRGRGRVYETILAVEFDLHAIYHSDWMDTKHPFALTPALEYNPTMKWGGCTNGKVIALRTLEQRILLHEVAHRLSPLDEGHGVVFARTFLALVREFMGFDEYALLKWAIEKEGQHIFVFLPNVKIFS